MTASKGFLELLEDLLSPLGPISVRRMFGGAGIYCDGQVFAFVDDDQLFLKTDAAGRAAFEEEGMGPFTYTTKHGPGTLMSYWRAPERLLEDPDEMVAWARTALGIARRAGAKAGSRRNGASDGTAKKLKAEKPKAKKRSRRG
jgi:DNA transformation protein